MFWVKLIVLKKNHQQLQKTWTLFTVVFLETPYKTLRQMGMPFWYWPSGNMATYDINTEGKTCHSIAIGKHIKKEMEKWKKLKRAKLENVSGPM